jgi:hypothetical protein
MYYAPTSPDYRGSRQLQCVVTIVHGRSGCTMPRNNQLSCYQHSLSVFGRRLPNGGASPGEFSPFHALIRTVPGRIGLGNHQGPDLSEHSLSFGYAQDNVINCFNLLLIWTQFRIPFYLASVHVHREIPRTLFLAKVYKIVEHHHFSIIAYFSRGFTNARETVSKPRKSWHD